MLCPWTASSVGLIRPDSPAGRRGRNRMGAPHTAEGSSCPTTAKASATVHPTSQGFRSPDSARSTIPRSRVRSRAYGTTSLTPHPPVSRAVSDRRFGSRDASSTTRQAVRRTASPAPDVRDRSRESSTAVAASTQRWLGFSGRHRRAWIFYVDSSDHTFKACRNLGRPGTHDPSADDSPARRIAGSDPEFCTSSQPRMGSPI